MDLKGPHPKAICPRWGPTLGTPRTPRTPTRRFDTASVRYPWSEGSALRRFALAAAAHAAQSFAPKVGHDVIASHNPRRQPPRVFFRQGRW